MIIKKDALNVKIIIFYMKEYAKSHVMELKRAPMMNYLIDVFPALTAVKVVKDQDLMIVQVVLKVKYYRMESA